MNDRTASSIIQSDWMIIFLFVLCFPPVGAQDVVPESDRCVVGGVQNSLQSALDLMAYVMGIIISNPKVYNIIFNHSY